MRKRVTDWIPPILRAPFYIGVVLLRCVLFVLLLLLWAVLPGPLFDTIGADNAPLVRLWEWTEEYL